MKAAFERLRSSGDDGIRLLWLDIGGEEGEMVSESYLTSDKDLFLVYFQ